ncbi:MAG: helix-turn-helix domain-containing protein [Cellvibrio sp.]|uniref:helix-turn-helix domain-containing protein n=1 Tax=Cellvibrio sp. TaxID=1965322 RepID=UPI0031AFA7D6
MIKRRPNYRLVKIHRNYTVEEVADLFGIHKNTVRQWIKKGLPLCDQKRPALILGRILAEFLQTQHTKNKRTCQAGEMYCLRCREPRKPVPDLLDYQPITDKVGNLTAVCSHCDALMNKRVSYAKLPAIQAQMGVTFPQAQKHIRDSNQPSLNSDLKGE